MLGPTFVSAYRNRILNIHPALLPSFPGLHGQADAAAYGVAISGATVHCVNEVMAGSSPHTWGTRGLRFRRRRRIGIIPTYVGNTPFPAETVRRRPDHPHIRGEHPSGIRMRLKASGSSPHTWGTRPAVQAARRRPRIIPTYVGNTPTIDELPLGDADHPHIRGEH